MLELSLDNSNEGWRGVVHSGEHSIWIDPIAHVTSTDAREAANLYVVAVFRAIFSLGSSDTSRVMEILETIDPTWLEAQALERETFGGKSFIENVLDIIKEKCSAA